MQANLSASPNRDPGTASSSRRLPVPHPACSVMAERLQQPAHTEGSACPQSLDNPQGEAVPRGDAKPAAADARRISKQPENMQSAGRENGIKDRAEGAEAAAASHMHQKPRWGQRHAPAVSWQLDVTSARDAASGQPRGPTSRGTGLSSASEAADAKDGSRGRDSSPARAGLPRHLDVQSALWRPPPPKARPLPPLPEFPVVRSTGLPSPSHDSACVQSLGAAMEISLLFADKPQTSEPKPVEEKLPGSAPDTPELLREHKTGPPKPSSAQKSEARHNDAGEAGAEGGYVRSGSPCIAVSGKSPEIARLQETLASLASLKLCLGSSHVTPDCSIAASRAPAETVPAGHISHEAGEMQQVAVGGQAPASRSICAAEERTADASSAGCGTAPEACSRITDSTWIYNPAANLENVYANAFPREGACTGLSKPEQQRAHKIGTGQCRRQPEVAQTCSLPDVSPPAGASPSEERLKKAPAPAGNPPQGPQQKDDFNAGCPEDAAPGQQV